MYYRISSLTKPGKGDDGICKLNSVNIKKSDSLNDFYYFSEKVLLSVNLAILKGSYINHDIYTFLSWLEHMIPSLNSFYYFLTQGNDPNKVKEYCFTNQHYETIQDKVKYLQKDYCGSKEFRVFSNDINLFYLNSLRVEIRKLELCYIKSLNKLSNDLELFNYKNLVSKVLNRLSTLIWIFLLKEEADNEITPKYWISKMPELNF